MNITQIVILIFALTIDLITTAARSGLLSIRYGKLETLKEEKDPKIKKVVELATQRTRLRATFKLAQTSLRLVIAGTLLVAFFPNEMESINGYLITLILVVIGVLIWITEFSIEHIVLNNPDKWAIRLSSFSNLLIKLLAPILALPMRFINSDDAAQPLESITEKELKSLVDASERAGEIEEDESKMIHYILDFGDTVAREVMIPRVDMLMLDIETTIEEAADALLSSGFSRVPLYEGEMDTIIGLLYTKDMLKAWRSGNGNASLRELKRDAKFIPETKKLDTLLDEMQADHMHIAIVVDEYGGISGLVTLEDIVEEVFGEIKDEYDDGEEELYQEIGPNEFLFLGRISLNDLYDVVGVDLTTKEADTLSGLIYVRLGRVPEVGETLQENGLLLTVEKLSGRRIHKVRATQSNAQ